MYGELLYALLCDGVRLIAASLPLPRLQRRSEIVEKMTRYPAQAGLSRRRLTLRFGTDSAMTPYSAPMLIPHSPEKGRGGRKRPPSSKALATKACVLLSVRNNTGAV